MRRKAKWAATAVKEQFQACCSYEAVIAHVQDNEELQERYEDFCDPLGTNMHNANVANATSITEASLPKAHEPTGVDRPRTTLCKAPALVPGKSTITKTETRELEPTSLQTCSKISALIKEQHLMQQQLSVVPASPVKLKARVEQCFATPISPNLQNSQLHNLVAPPKLEPTSIKASKDVVHNVDVMVKTSKHGAQGIQQSWAKPISKQVLQKGTRPLGTGAQPFIPEDLGVGVSMPQQASPPIRLKRHVSGPLPGGVGISPTSRGMDNGARRSPHTHVPKLKHVSGPLPRTHLGVSQGALHVGSPCSASQFKTNKQHTSKASSGQLELMAILELVKKPSKGMVAHVEESKRNKKPKNTSNLGGDIGKHPLDGANAIHVSTCNPLQERHASQPSCAPPLTMLERCGSRGSRASRDQGERMHQVGQDVGGCTSSTMQSQAMLAHAPTLVLTSLSPSLHQNKRVSSIPMPNNLRKERHQAAAKIQAAFRGFMVRRAITRQCQSKEVNDGGEEVEHADARSVSTCMSRIEVQHDKRMQHQQATTSKECKEWNGSIRTAQDCRALLRSKQEAAMKRERALEYALLRQNWKTGSKSQKGTLQWSREDQMADKLGWVWSWLDRATHVGGHASKNHDSLNMNEQQSRSDYVKSTEGLCTTDIGSSDLDYQGWKNSQEWPLSLRQQHAIGLLQSNQSVPKKSSPGSHKASITVSPMSFPTDNATPPRIEVASKLAKPPNLCQVCAQDMRLEENVGQHLQLGREDVSTTSESRMSMESEASMDEASKLRVQKLLNFLDESSKDDQESVGSCPGVGPSLYKQLTSPFVGPKTRSRRGGRQPTHVLQHKAPNSNSNKETVIQAQISVALSNDDFVGTTAASIQQPS